MSLGKKLLGAFVTFESDAPQSVSVVSQAPAQLPLPAPDAKPIIAAVSTLVDTIKATVLAKQTPFVIVLTAADRLKTIVEDPQKRIQAAAATAAVTPSQLHDAIKYHFDMLSQIEKTTEADIKQAYATRVSDVEAKIKTSDDHIAQLTSQINQLKTEIDTVTSSQVELKTIADQNRLDLQQQTANTQAALAEVRSFILSTQEQMAIAIKS
jgi:hypothetical protein